MVENKNDTHNIPLKQLKESIQNIILPSDQSVADSRILQDIQEKDNSVTVILDLHDHPNDLIPFLKNEIIKRGQQYQIACDVVFTKNKPQSIFINNTIPNVKRVIAIASGKGGVGKSTTAVQIALALSQNKLNVGLLDLDVYGPSLPKLVNIYDKPDTQNGKLIPFKKFGIQLLSLGFLVDESQAMIWRGPVVQTAVKQLLFDTIWGDTDTSLDYLILDLPPGTGDVQLTLAQKVKVDGAIIVSTPQDLALIDARRAISMFEKVDVPIIGMIENMSMVECPNCSHTFHPFGHQGVEKTASQHNIQFLGDVPLFMALGEASDQGNPLFYKTSADEDLSIIREIYRKIALNVLKHFATNV